MWEVRMDNGRLVYRGPEEEAKEVWVRHAYTYGHSRVVLKRVS